MSNNSPFSQLFQIFGRVPEKHVDSINKPAFEKMLMLLKSPLEASGSGILLRAPRAGYGKTHLLSRLSNELSASHEFILLQPADGYRVDASAALMDVLAKLTRSLPAGGGLTMLDMAARKILAMGLEPLVRSGEVPCQDRDMALSALRFRPTETFDFHLPIAVTAHWARDNFEALGPRLAVEIAQIIGAPLREVSFWVDVMFRYSVTPVDQPGRSGLLMIAVANAAATNMMDRFTALLKMLSHLSRIVLVADELEGMSANEEAALRLAAFVTALRHGAERVDFIISVNDDVWENAFVPRLSGGLQDRLSESVVRLSPLTAEQVKELLNSRDSTTSEEISGELLSAKTEMYSRGILRAAAGVWQAKPITTKEVFPEVFKEEPQVIVEDSFSSFESEVVSELIVGIPDSIPAPLDTPASLNTVAISWQPSDRSVVAVDPGDSIIIPKKPIFIPPAMHEPAFPHTEEIFPQAAPTTSPFEEIATHQQSPPAPVTPWWAEYENVSNVTTDSNEPAVTEFANTPFIEPESPFVSFANPELQEYSPSNAFCTQPFTPTLQAVEKNLHDAPVSTEQFEGFQLPTAVSYDSYSNYGVPSVTPSPAEIQATITTPAKQDIPVPSPYGDGATTLLRDHPATSDKQNQAPTDRVDDLLRQFRERYGRS
jgi:hypothetical protein